jgi:protocatechuate 3,4-dioxygenase beta subunit
VPSPAYRVRGKPAEEVAQRIVLKSGGGAIHGVVRDPGGAPCANARVRIGPFDRPGETDWQGMQLAAPPVFEVRTDAQGRYHAEGIPPGRPAVSARAKGAAPRSVSAKIEPGAATALDLDLSAGISVAGTVVDEAGGPLAGAFLRLVSKGRTGAWDCSTRTRPDGSFTLRDAGSGQAVVYASQGRARTERELTLGPKGLEGLRLVVATPRSEDALAGTLVDERGQPLAGWIVEATTYRNQPWGGHARTAAGGTFTFEKCPDEAMRIDVRQPANERSFATLTRHGVRRGDGPLRIVVPDAATQNGTLVAKLVDTASAPLLRAELMLWQVLGDRGHTAQADEHGVARDALLPQGRYRVSAQAEGYARVPLGSFELRPGEVVDLGAVRMARGRMLRVGVLDADGKDAQLPRGTILDAAGNEVCTFAGREPGELAIGPIAPGRYAALVQAHRMACRRIEVEVGEDPAPLEWRLERGVMQRLVLEEPKEARPLRAFELRIYSKDGLVEAARRHGGAEHERLVGTAVLAAGSYRAEAETDTGLRGSTRFTVERTDAETTPVVIRVR